VLAHVVRDHVDLLRGEVDNGGFEQYFTNSSGDNLYEAMTALDLIGAVRTASILRRACAKFPTGLPDRDWDRRQRQLDLVYRRGMFDTEDQDFFREDDDLEALVRAYELAEDREILGDFDADPAHDIHEP
jgi:hypothetical protein